VASDARTTILKGLATVILAAFAAAPSLEAEELSTVLAGIDSDPILGRAIWAFDVRDADGREVASRQPDQLMATGSVRKLFTAAVVADCEGLNATITTDVLLRGTPGRRGAWNGALVIVARGDPTLGGRWEYESDRLARIRPVVEELRKRGISTLRDGIVVDVSAFEANLVGDAWKTDNLRYSYAAPVDAAAFNENAVSVLVIPRGCAAPAVAVDPPWIAAHVATDCGDSPFEVELEGIRSVSVRGSMRDVLRDTVFLAQQRPAEALGDAFRIAIEEAGIRAGKVSVDRRPREGSSRDAPPVFRIDSPPVGAMLGSVLADSSNLYAEMLFKRLSRGEGTASWNGSLAIERAFLTNQVGLEPATFRFDDGGGLSPENLVTARSTVELLRYARSAPAGREFWEASLAKPGEEGTLRRRLPELTGRLFAKTGTIDGVAGLAGWLYREDGTLRYFAIFVNNHAAPPREVTKAIDRIVLAIAE
jgi:D-alanyl-D-alanine carboxypeptidase/D-alanyl-D-alanine-endopeptidase (penicillin-binding protein 4)